MHMDGFITTSVYYTNKSTMLQLSNHRRGMLGYIRIRKADTHTTRATHTYTRVLPIHTDIHSKGYDTYLDITPKNNSNIWSLVLMVDASGLTYGTTSKYIHIQHDGTRTQQGILRSIVRYYTQLSR
jgi:hypothetical protein